MKKEELKKKVEELIATGQTVKAIEELLKVESPEIRRQIVILSSRMRGLKQNANMGLLRHEDVNLEESQINNSLLGLVESIPEQTVISNQVNTKLLNILDQKKNKIEYYKSVVTLLTSILALIVAGIGVWKSIDNSDNISSIEKENKLLKFANMVEIISPFNGDTLSSNVSSINGVMKLDLPEGKKLRVFAESGNLFYPMKGNVEVTAKGDWNFDNISLGLKGDIYLLVCLVDREIGQILDTKLDSGDYRGEPKLDVGVLILDKVKIFKK